MTTDSGHHMVKRVARYEGLVRKTTSMYYQVFNEEFDEFAATLRLKVYEALVSYDSSRSKMTEEAYVFSCVRNRVKDFLRKLQVRSEAGWSEPVLIEDIAPSTFLDDSPQDAFEHRFMATDEEEAYDVLLADIPDMPVSLTREEEQIVALLYVGYNQPEVAEQLGITRSQAISAVKKIQAKMGEWGLVPAGFTPEPTEALAPAPA